MSTAEGKYSLPTWSLKGAILLQLLTQIPLCGAGREVRPGTCFRKSLTSFVSAWSLGSNCQMVYAAWECKTGNKGKISYSGWPSCETGNKEQLTWFVTYPPTSRVFNISLHNPPSQIFCPCVLSVIRLSAFGLNCKCFPSSASRSPCLLEELS